LEFEDIFEMSDEIARLLLNDRFCLAVAAHIWGQKFPNEEYIPEDELHAVARMVREAGSRLFMFREVLRGNLKWEFNKDKTDILVHKIDVEGLKTILDLTQEDDDSDSDN